MYSQRYLDFVDPYDGKWFKPFKRVLIFAGLHQLFEKKYDYNLLLSVLVVLIVENIQCYWIQVTQMVIGGKKITAFHGVKLHAPIGCQARPRIKLIHGAGLFFCRNTP